MHDFKFTFVKKVEIVIEADNENDAWMKVAQLNPEMLGAEWEITQGSSVKEEIPLDQGPVEIDDWGPVEF